MIVSLELAFYFLCMLFAFLSLFLVAAVVAGILFCWFLSIRWMKLPDNITVAVQPPTLEPLKPSVPPERRRVRNPWDSHPAAEITEEMVES